jgi:hypothetical protein
MSYLLPRRRWKLLLLLVPLTFIIILFISDRKLNSSNHDVVVPQSHALKSERFESDHNNNAVDSNDLESNLIPVLKMPGELAPGEMGKPFKPKNLTDAQKKIVSEGWKNNAFNQFVSDAISIHRELPDPRDEWSVFFFTIRILRDSSWLDVAVGIFLGDSFHWHVGCHGDFFVQLSLRY